MTYHPPLPRTLRTGRTADLLAAGWIYVKRSSERTTDTEWVDFGVRDQSGRRVGVLVNRHVMTVTQVEQPSPYGGSLGQPEELGEWFGAWVQAGRDGKGFGPCQPTHWFRTETEALAWLGEAVAATRKRYAKKWAA